MTLDELFKQRKSIHQKQLSRYMKYVFNDHFVIALLFLMGAAGFGYSEYVNTLGAGEVMPQIFVVALLTLFLSFGGVATLLKPADAAFILPKEDFFFSIIKQLTIRSFFILSIPIGMISAITMPVLVRTGAMSFEEWPLFFLSMAGWKLIELISRLYLFQEADFWKRKWIGIGVRFLTCIGLCVSVFATPLLGCILSAICVVLVWIIFNGEVFKKRRWHWEEMIDSEGRRLQNIYRFINLFTDVPFISTQTKRLKFLDVWINWLSNRWKEVPFFYLIRVFYRNTTYSGLVLRLIIIGSLLIYFSDLFVLTLLLNVLFLYLIGFQLMPLLQHFENNLYFRLYPIGSAGKIDAIKRLIFQIMIFSGSILAFFSFPIGIVEAGAVLFADIVFSLCFSYLYLPYRLQKANKV